MQLNYLIEFAEIARCRNYAEAADNLFISESSLSRHIKKLEEELGVPVFHRSTRKIELTDFGRELLDCADQAREIEEDINGILAKYLKDGDTRLHIAAVDTFHAYLPMDEWIDDFKKSNPNISFEISSPTLSAGKLLKNSDTTVCFVPELAGYEDPELERLNVCSDELIAVLPADHPLAAREELSLSDLRKEQFVLLTANTPMFEMCMKACGQHGFRPSVRMTADGRYIKEMVRKGFGIGLLCGRSSMSNMDSSLILKSFNPSVKVNMNLLYLKGSSPSVKRYITFMRQYIEGKSQG